MRLIQVCLSACLFATGLSLAQEAQKTGVDEKTIRSLIAALGDEAFQKRDAAHKALADIGRPALPLLRKAVADAADIEARERAVQLLREISSRPGPGAFFPPTGIPEIALSRNGQTIAVAGADKIVRIYDWNTLALRHSLSGHKIQVWSIAVAADGRAAASGSGEYDNDKVPGEIIIWDLTKGAALWAFKGHDGPAFGLVFSHDGKRLYSGGWDGALRVWDPATGKELAVLRGHMGPIRRLFLTADGKSIVSGGFDGTVRFWNSDSLKEERQIMTFAEGVGCADVSADGKWLVAGTRPSYPPDPAVIKVWDIATGKEKATIKGTTRKIASLAVSPDGASLAMGGGFWNELGEIKIFDLGTGRERATFIDHKDMVACVAFSRDGQWLVSGGGGQRTLGEVRIWDAKRLVAKGE